MSLLNIALTAVAILFAFVVSAKLSRKQLGVLAVVTFLLSIAVMVALVTAGYVEITLGDGKQ